MDAASVKFHRAVLRLAKGLCSAYEEWLSERTVEVLTSHLKEERNGLSKRSPLDNSVNKL